MKTRLLTVLLLLTLLPTFAPTATPSAALPLGHEALSPITTSQMGALSWEPVLPDVRSRIWRSPWYDANRTLYAVTDERLLRTTDDGNSWTPLYITAAPTATLTSMAFDPGTTWGPTLFAVTNDPGNVARVLRSRDDGLNWQTVLTDTAKPLADIAAAREADGKLVVFAVGDTHAWRSPDGGDTWLSLDAALPEWAYLYRIFISPEFAADKTVYLTGFNPPLRSTDGGFTWQTLAVPWVDIARDVIFSPNYAADGTLWMSYFWIEGSGEDDLPMNGVVRSTDRGITWQKAREGLPVEWPDGWILGLAVSPEYASDKALFLVERVATMEGTAYEFYRTNNRGDTWILQGLAPNHTPRGLIAVRRDLLFLPTSDGLYRLRLLCSEWIRNGSCEINEAWDLPATPITAAYSTEQALSPTRSIRVGLTTAANRMGYSSARQRIVLPSTLSRAMLRFWLYPVSTEVQTAELPPEATTLPATMAGDVQYVLLLSDQGTILKQLVWMRSNEREWLHITFDLDPYIGQTLWLLFGVYNDGVGGKTGMYVDDVTIQGCLPPSTPPAAPPPPQTNLIKQDFLLSDAANAQTNPAIAYNPEDDEYLLAWEYTRSETESDIFIRRISSAGKLLGEAIPLTTGPELQVRPHVAYMPAADRYLVVWQEHQHPGSAPDVYGRLVTRAGAPEGAPFPIAVAAAGQIGPRVAAGDGAFLVVWTDALPAPARIRGQRLDGAGTLLGTAFDISNGAGWAAFSDVAYSPVLGDFFVAWQDTRAGAHDDVYVQRVTPAGALSGNNIAVSNALGNQEFVALAANTANTRVLFVWNDSRGDSRQLYGRELDFSGGAPQTPEFRVSTHPIQEGPPAVAYWPATAAAGYRVVWEAPTGAGDLLTRRILTGGGPIGLPTIVSDDPHTQTRPALAVATEGAQPSALAVWRDYRAGDKTGIYGQRLDENGARLGLHFGLTPLPRLQTQPAVAYSNTSDRSLVAWANVWGGGGNQSTRVMGYLLDGDGILASAPITFTERVLTTTTQVSVDWDYWNDEFLVAWSGAGDIIGQRVTANGNLQGGNFVISALDGAQRAPVVVAGRGEHLVIFEATHPLSATTDIFGQFVAGAGARLGDAFNISRLPGPAQQAWNPHATYDAINNTFFVVWQEQNPTSPGIPLWDIVGQMVAGEDGSLLGPRRILADVLEMQESHPRVAWGGPEDVPFYLLVWAAFDMNTGQSEIMARRLEQNGAPGTPPYALTATAGEQEIQPALTYDPFTRRFLAVWDVIPQGAGAPFAIRGQQLDGDGAPEGEVLPVAEDAASARRSPTATARRNHGEWLIAWEDGRVDTAVEHINIYARRAPITRRIFLPLVLRQ